MNGKNRFYEPGKKLILDGALSQLELMDSIRDVKYCSQYGSSDIFEIALRGIGENVLAEKFVNPNPEVKAYVERIGATPMFLEAIINNLEKGNREFAGELEKVQREYFHLEGTGYFNPHFYWAPGMKESFEESKDEISDNIKKWGLIETKRYREARARNRLLKYRGGSGEVSVKETLLAINANIVLGNKDFARKVLDELYKYYFDESTGLFTYDSLGFGRAVVASQILKSADLLGDERGRQISGLLEKESEFQDKPSKYALNELNLAAFAHVLDHFQEGDRLDKVREKILQTAEIDPSSGKTIDSKLKDKKEEIANKGVLFFGHDSHVNVGRVKTGLALTGLERDKPNYLLL